MKMRTAILVGMVCLALGALIGMALRPAPVVAADKPCGEGARIIRVNDSTFAVVGTSQVGVYQSSGGWSPTFSAAPQ